MVQLSEKQRIEILMMYGYGDRKRTQEEVRLLFNNLYPDTPITQSTVSKILKKFYATGTVANLPKSGRPRTATNEDHKENVLLSVEEQPKNSLRNVGRDVGISHTSVQRILKNEKFHPYKVIMLYCSFNDAYLRIFVFFQQLQLIHELGDDDFDRRVEFCQEMIGRCDDKPDFPFNILFSDEATFMLNGTVNRHNCRYWSIANPHWVQEHHTQYPQKVNVWAGILRGHVIGPFFLDDTLNAERYLSLLQNHILPAVEALFPGEDGGFNQDIIFQQDGAPPHFGVQVRNYLNFRFPGKWIGRRGPIEWPARSPDLTPLDFFLWGYLKHKVYKSRPQCLEELRERISTEIREIPFDVLSRSVNQFTRRLTKCVEVNGAQFEHLL